MKLLKNFKCGIKTIHFGHCKILPCFWKNTSQSYQNREVRGLLERMSCNEMETFCDGIQNTWCSRKHFYSSTSWFHCRWVSQFHFPGQSVDRVSSFHSLQSQSYPFQRLGSSVHVVTSAQQCRLQGSLPAHWWLCGGGPWEGQEEGKMRCL